MLCSMDGCSGSSGLVTHVVRVDLRTCGSNEERENGSLFMKREGRLTATNLLTSIVADRWIM